MTDRPRPSDVFTPGKLPLREGNVYATRAAPEGDFERFLERAQIPLVVGEYGVGKTSLVRRYFQEREPDANLVYVASASGLPLDDIYKYVLEKLNYTVTTNETVGRATEGGLGFRGLRASRRRESGETRELVVTSPTDLTLLDIMAEEAITLVVDEMHTSTDELRRDLSIMIKAARTADKDFPRVALVGTAFDAERLAKSDPGIDRYVKDVVVHLLKDEEAEYIVREGFRRLALEVPDGVVEGVVATAAGAPTIVHNVCLDMAEMALEDDREHVTDVDLDAAIYLYLEDHGKRLYSAYMKAIETTGPKRWRKRVLHAVANADSDYATSADITSEILKATGDEATTANVGEPLHRLKSEEFGSVLKDVERFDGHRVHNLTAFTDPMMKAFIRFMGKVDDRGVELPPVEGAPQARP